MSLLLNQLSLTLTRPAEGEGYYENGEWVPPSDTTIDIRCSIQPYQLTSEDMLILPAGLSSKDSLVVFTKTQVKTVSQYTQTEADTTIIDGLTYVAFKVKNWARHTSFKMAHYQVTFVRKDVDKAGGI